MIAAIDQKITARVGELAFFDILDPGSINPDGNVVLCLTGNGACMTANALALVDDKGIFRHVYSLFYYRERLAKHPISLEARERGSFCEVYRRRWQFV